MQPSECVPVPPSLDRFGRNWPYIPARKDRLINGVARIIGKMMLGLVEWC